jgi:hypothetical protein
MFFSEGLPVHPAQMANTPGAFSFTGVFFDVGDLRGIFTVDGSLNMMTHKARKSFILGGTLFLQVERLSIERDGAREVGRK